METILIALVGTVVAVLLVGIALLFYEEERKTRDLGGPPEMSGRSPSPWRRPSRAQPKEVARPKGASTFIPKPLLSVDAARFSDEWRAVQKRFVSEPRNAIGDADRLAGEVMRARGWGSPALRQSGSPSEEHPVIAVNYRRAHEIFQKNELGNARSNELRQALIHYRVLFAELLEIEEPVLTHA